MSLNVITCAMKVSAKLICPGICSGPAFADWWSENVEAREITAADNTETVSDSSEDESGEDHTKKRKKRITFRQKRVSYVE